MLNLSTHNAYRLSDDIIVQSILRFWLKGSGFLQIEPEFLNPKPT